MKAKAVRRVLMVLSPPCGWTAVCRLVNQLVTCRRFGTLSAIHGSAGHCRFPILLLPVVSATRCTTISDRGRIEIVGTSIHALQVGLLQRSAGRNSWHLGETASISPEHCGSVSLWCSTPGPYHTVLCSLHWLPVRRRIFFKTAVLVWKCIHDVAPAYLQEACLPVESVPGRPRLRSASTGCVELPRVLTSTGQRSLSFHGPTVWNSLPSALRDDSLSLNTFSRRLKTYLFGQ